MAEVASLWVGDRMSKIQQLCLSSFVAYGHSVSLFVYGNRDDVPPGVMVRDASKIMPLDNIGHLAHFADVFRFNMVQQTGIGWIDADTLCLTEDWSFLDNCYAISEKGSIQNGIFRLPPESEILDFIVKKATSIDRSNSSWTETNSGVLIEAFERFPEYKKYLVDESIVNGIPYEGWHYLWDPEKLSDMIKLSKRIKSFSIYNEMVSRSGMDKNNFPKGSAMEYFEHKIMKKKQNV